MTDTILIPADLEKATAALCGEIPLSDVPTTRIQRPSNVVPLPKPPAVAARAEAPFATLGVAGDEYVFLTGHDGETAGSIKSYSVAALNKNALLSLAPLDWWLSAFPKPTSGKDDAEPRVAWDRATDFLIREASRRHFNPRRMRGRGTWLDNGRVVVHAGDRLYIDGNVVDIRAQAAAGLKYLYVSKAPVDHGRHSEPLDAAGGGKMIAAIKKFSWKRERDALVLAGWLFCAAQCGALRWRPNVWLTALPGSGKSELYKRVIGRVLDKIGGTRAAGDSSEAGIRQELAGDAFPVLLDEAEAGKDRNDKKRVARILALARLGAADEAPPILRGTTGGTSLAFEVHSSFLWSSVEPTIVTDADVSRIAVIQLEEPNKSAEAQQQWRRDLVEIDDAFSASACEAFAARAQKLAPVMVETADRFSLAGATLLGSGRAGDVYGLIAAGLWHLTRADTPSVDAAAEFMREIGFTADMVPVAGADRDRLVGHLFQLSVEFGHLEHVEGKDSRHVRRYKLAGLLDTLWHQAPSNPMTEKSWNDFRESAYEALRQVGIRFADGDGKIVPIERWRSAFSKSCKRADDPVERWQLVVARRHPALDRHFGEESCGVGYGLQLERSGGALANPVRFGGLPSVCRAIALPLSLERDD
jgi:hypothetical protein